MKPMGAGGIGTKAGGLVTYRSRHTAWIFLLLATFTGDSPAFTRPGAGPERKLVIMGAGSSIGPMKQIADGFQRKHPDIAIDLISGIGSMGAIKAVLAGRVDIGLTSRPLTPIERGMDLIATPYGRTPFIFTVQGSNPTDAVTFTEIEHIYAGSRKVWPDGRRVRVVLRPLHADSALFLSGIDLRLKSASEKAYATPGVIIAMTDQEAAEQIEKTPGSFGTTDASLLALEKRKIKALSVDGVFPYLFNIPDGIDISTGKYPYVISMSMVYKKDNDTGAVRDFIAFVFSKNGRKILAACGYVILPYKTGK